ncbi:MAG: hypothetical protein A3J38_06545 [Gammaproteobacteria bacterium RIFCSPHIGHO2_12_FULL_45_9]|nr:MAG: hypothetical protein A3J38_06545 [Gammaproteobacteria bacterium RIFCSPHIGHO2_12_FULL_45_9]
MNPDQVLAEITLVVQTLQSQASEEQAHVAEAHEIASYLERMAVILEGLRPILQEDQHIGQRTHGLRRAQAALTRLRGLNNLLPVLRNIAGLQARFQTPNVFLRFWWSDDYSDQLDAYKQDVNRIIGSILSTAHPYPLGPSNALRALDHQRILGQLQDIAKNPIELNYQYNLFCTQQLNPARTEKQFLLHTLKQQGQYYPVRTAAPVFNGLMAAYVQPASVPRMRHSFFAVEKPHQSPSKKLKCIKDEVQRPSIVTPPHPVSPDFLPPARVIPLVTPSPSIDTVVSKPF